MILRLSNDPLFNELIVLARDLREHDIRLFVAGGYGLVLRTEYIRESGVRTLRPIPSARSTEDLDLFMTADLIVDERRVKSFRDVLHANGYQSVRGREHYQFIRTTEIYGQKRAVKIDLLTAVPENERERSGLKWKGDRRVRPKQVTGIHAHPSPEAVTLTENPHELSISDEKADPVSIWLPHPFTYLLLKLFAARDQMSRDRGSHERHASDLYRILATTTEEEWNGALELSRQYRAHSITQEAGEIVRTHFGDRTAPAIIAVRTFLRQAEIGEAAGADEFMRDLLTLFPGS